MVMAFETATAGALGSRTTARWASAILLGLLVVIVGIAIFGAMAGAGFRVPQSFNEGWNAYLARAAYEGPLYFPDDWPVTNNYPPLSFYLIGGFAQFGGDPLFIGRYVNGAAVLLSALAIYAVLRLLDTDRLPAASCALAFIGFICLGFADAVATDDPQWLGHSVMLAGLVIFLRGYPRPAAVAGAALVMLAAGLVKHNLLPLPLAVTVWLLLYDRARFRLWLIAGVVGGAAAFAVIGFAFGTDAIRSILFLKREYSLLQVGNALYQYVAPTLPLLVLFFLSEARSDRRALLLFHYALIALVWDVYTMGAVGVAANGMFDYFIAVALLTGVMIGRLAEAVRPYALAAIILPLAVVTFSYPKPHRVWQSYERLEAQFREDEALVRAADGPVLCYTAALCYWAGKDFDYDPYNEARKMNLSPDYRAKTVRKLRAKEFALIQVNGLDYFPPDFVAALNDSYVLFKTSKTGRRFYHPR